MSPPTGNRPDATILFYADGMGALDRSRATLASVVGWIVVIIIGLILLTFLWSVVAWIFKAVLVLVLLGVLLWIYFSLKAPRERSG